MAYTAKDAFTAFNDYLGITITEKQILQGTKNRGFILKTNTQEEAVIFLYPLVHKQDNAKTYFDTRDSGAWERQATWEYALEHKMKYFCLGLNSDVKRYENYIFSLEIDERAAEVLSGTKNGDRDGPGNQVIIPIDFTPSKPFERIQNKLGVYISVIRKDVLMDYLTMFDNRPYLVQYNNDILDAAEKPELEGGFSLRFKTSLENELPRNRIIFGAPGTGKSYTLNTDKEQLLGTGNESDYERVTFHPDYSYANFVGTYKPVPCVDSDGKDAITYEYVPGPFMRIYVKALKNGMTRDPKPFLLIIEEINRANVAAVFGDIFQLLDRGKDQVSEYPIQASEDIRNYLAKELGGNPSDYCELLLPDNLFIWATMNSADQGVFPMDTAFKRRWDFTYLGINDCDEEIRGKYVCLGSDKSQKVEWNKLRKAINNFLAKEKINEDKQLGPYFISRDIIVPETGSEINREQFIHTFKNKVIMYLFEDAAKQKRSQLFAGCFQDCSRYSEICEAFDKLGIGIFNSDIQSEAEPVQTAEYTADDSR